MKILERAEYEKTQNGKRVSKRILHERLSMAIVRVEI